MLEAVADQPHLEKQPWRSKVVEAPMSAKRRQREAQRNADNAFSHIQVKGQGYAPFLEY